MPEQLLGGASLRTPMAYQDYRALGETKHHEYYDGLCVVNPPSRSHSRIQAHLVDLIRPHCPRTHEVLTGWGWHVGPELDFEPDILVTDRSSPDDDVLRHPPPLLVVEISSPSTRDVDWGSKRRSYASGGASWYWIVELRRLEIVVFEHRDGDLVEIQRITTPALAAGPFPVLIDPGAFPAR
ncbi:MAG TPA: Uma2 family endonuclease [Acidimicrobiia bacterium]|nr:Uma2 family endonuclease [Acidimicrobiia bacterium]